MATLNAGDIAIGAARSRDFGALGCVLQGTPPGGTPKRYILTCSHVLGSPGHRAPGTSIVRKVIPDVQDAEQVATLIAVTDPVIDRIDIGLAELSVNIDPALGQLGLSRGWTWLITTDQRLRAVTPHGQSITTTIRNLQPPPPSLHYVWPNGGSDDATLEGTIQADLATLEAGDSGSILIDDNQLIVGIYTGKDSTGNAVITPIKAALAKVSQLAGFSLQPVIDLTPFPSPPPPGTSPWPDPIWLGPPGNASGGDGALLANLFYTEARNQLAKPITPGGPPIGLLAYCAIAEVVINRRRKSKQPFSAICVPAQFNGLSQAQVITDAQAKLPKEYQAAQTVAAAVIAGWSGNLTKGATHYFAPVSMNPPGSWPDWALDRLTGAKLTPSLILGDHYFFNNVA